MTTFPSNLQAIFRGNQSRKLHVERVKKNLVWSPYLGAKKDAIITMLKSIQINENDILIDLGSGDGRILDIAMNVFNIKNVIGVEIDPLLVKQSIKLLNNTCNNNNKYQIILNDWTLLNKSLLLNITIVTLFFLPHSSICTLLKDKFSKGTKIITYVYQIKEWKPIKIIPTVSFTGNSLHSSNIYLYEI